MPGSAPDGTGMADWPTSRLFEQRLPPGLRNPVVGQPQNLADNAKIDDQVYRFKGSSAETSKRSQGSARPVVDTHGAMPKALAVKSGSSAQDEGRQQQVLDSVTEPSVGSASQTSALSPNADGSGLQFLNRISPRDESGYNNNKPPVQRLGQSSTKNKPGDQHRREMEVFKAAKANHDWNKNSQTLKAWKNFDRAIELMKRTPEGRAVLDRLNNGNDKSFHVMMVKNNGDENIYPELLRLGIRLRQGENGRYSYVTRVNGKEQHVILLLESAMSGNTLKPDGTINPDAESLENVWHELYHASELHPSGGIDPLNIGTSSAEDWNKNPELPDKAPTIHPQAHERRAVRFENIIRRRNGGTRVKNKYGGRLKKNPDGTSSIVDQVDVPSPVPPRPPHLPPLSAAP